MSFKEKQEFEALEKESTDLQNLMTEKRLNKESMQKSIEEWQEWYAKEQAAKKIESSKEPVSESVIDLLPS